MRPRVRFKLDEELGAKSAVLGVSDPRDAPLYLQHVKLDLNETTCGARCCGWTDELSASV